MTARLTDELCPFCGSSQVRHLLTPQEWAAQIDMAHDEAKESEGLRLALCFAELGYVPEMRLEPERTLPLGWRAEFLLVMRGE